MNNYETYLDADLLALCKCGDDEAFRTIYDRYWEALYRHAYRMLKNDEEARDVTQDTFIRLWDRIGDLELESSLKAYLYTTVRNRVLNIFEKEQNQAKFMSSLADFLEHSEAITDHRIRERMLQDKIDKEVSMLPPKMQNIFRMSRTHHLSHQEIAEALNLSDKTVKKQVSNAIKILRLKLTGFISILPLFISY